MSYQYAAHVSNLACLNWPLEYKQEFSNSFILLILKFVLEFVETNVLCKLKNGLNLWRQDCQKRFEKGDQDSVSILISL